MSSGGARLLGRRAAMEELRKVQRKMAAYNHSAEFLAWDSAVNASRQMPALQARAHSISELQMMQQRTMVDPKVEDLLRAAVAPSSDATEDGDVLTKEELANIREFSRKLSLAKLSNPVMKTRAPIPTARHNWGPLRAKGDWKSFVPYLTAVVDEKRAHGQQLAANPANQLTENGGTGGVEKLSPYDALLDHQDPGLRSVQVEATVKDIKGWLPDLIKEVQSKQKMEGYSSSPHATGPFRVEKQKALFNALSTMLGFDFSKGSVDVTNLSPDLYCLSSGADVRIVVPVEQTQYRGSLAQHLNLMGEALYKQNLPTHNENYIGQFLGEARGGLVTQAQSYFMSNEIGRSAAFATALEPLLREHFGGVKSNAESFQARNLHRRLTYVNPTYMMSAADELTHPLHLILRCELESSLMKGDMDVPELDVAWGFLTKQLLGLDVKNKPQQTVFQDIEWPSGQFGLFPTKLMGLIAAAQFNAAMERDLGGKAIVHSSVSQGVFTPVHEWLRSKVWSLGSFPVSTDALLVAATGESLNVKYFRQHLTQRYLIGDSTD